MSARSIHLRVVRRLLFAALSSAVALSANRNELPTTRAEARHQRRALHQLFVLEQHAGQARDRAADEAVGDR